MAARKRSIESLYDKPLTSKGKLEVGTESTYLYVHVNTCNYVVNVRGVFRQYGQGADMIC